MNKAEVSPVLWLILTLVFVSLLILFGMFFGDNLLQMVKGTRDFASCEIGTVQGMCVSSSFNCPSSGISNPGNLLSGCPSGRIKNVFDGVLEKDDVKDYTQCCIVAYCEDVADKKEGVTYTRTESCFDEDKCSSDLKKSKVKEEKCLGFSENCKKEDGCCCVQGW